MNILKRREHDRPRLRSDLRELPGRDAQLPISWQEMLKYNEICNLSSCCMSSTDFIVDNKCNRPLIIKLALTQTLNMFYIELIHNCIDTLQSCDTDLSFYIQSSLRFYILLSVVSTWGQ